MKLIKSVKIIKLWTIGHAIDIIEHDRLWDRFYEEFGELEALTYDEYGEGITFETVNDLLKRKNITLEQLIKFLNTYSNNNKYYID